MLVAYEALISPYEDGYEVEFPDIPGCTTQGEDLQDAFVMAYDALGLTLHVLSEEGGKMPDPKYGRVPLEGEMVVVIVVDLDRLDFAEKYVTVKVAQDMLGGVSSQRIQALIRSGDLISEKVGTGRFIDQQSVVDYRKRRKGVGRPKAAFG